VTGDYDPVFGEPLNSRNTELDCDCDYCRTGVTGRTDEGISLDLDLAWNLWQQQIRPRLDQALTEYTDPGEDKP